MKKTFRYCINCGQEIGDDPTCSGVDCGGIPNFYRDVAGPDPDELRPSLRVRERPTAQARALPSGPPPTSAADARRTIPLEALPVAVLRSTAPPQVEYPIAAGITVVGARQPAGLIIDAPAVSSRHARFDCTEAVVGGWRVVLSDLRSRNGTFVNGRRIADNCQLRGGERVRFADVEFDFRMLDVEPLRVTIPL